MVSNGNVACRSVPSFIKGLTVLRVLVNRYVESTACSYGDILVIWRMVDAVFTDKLETSIIFILLKNSYCTLGEGNP